MFENQWGAWQKGIESFLADRRVLPTMAAAKLDIPFDIVTDAWMATDKDELSKLCRLPSAAGEPSERAATILFLWHLTTDDPYLLPEPFQSEWKSTLASLIAEALSLMPVEFIDRPWQIRWELLYAAAAARWDRVDDLVRRWIVLAPDEEVSARAALARVLVLSVHPGRQADFRPDWWLPYEGAGDTDLGTALVSLYVLHVGEPSSAQSGTWGWPTSLGDSEYARVLDAAANLGRIRDSRFHEEREALRAWCDAVFGVRAQDVHTTLRAADRYRNIAEDQGLRKGLAPIPLASAALLYRIAGDLDQARRMAVVLTEQLPDSPDAWRLRAQLERKLGLGVDAVADSYEQFVRLSPDTDDSWEHTELLRLLLESRDNDTAQRAVADLALSHPERAVALELAGWDWPSFSRLSDATRELWWKALVLACDPRIRQAMRGTPWRNAAADFGESVAVELRIRVFAPFAKWDGFKPTALNGKEAEIAKVIGQSRLTFGAMATVMRRTADSRSVLGQQLAVFLHKFHRPLREHLKNPTALDRLEQAVTARNEAAHGDVTEDQARQIFRDAKALLEIITREDPRHRPQPDVGSGPTSR